MVNTEKCPKCGGRMVPNSAGYSRANVSSGFGAPLPDSYSCISCGKYVEVFNNQQYIGKKSNYPKVRKPMGEPSWLRTVIEKHFDEVVELRNKFISWEKIAEKLNKGGTSPEFIDFISLGNIYRRILKERQNA